MCSCAQVLKWLDLKDNPLELGLAKAAGDCLDEKQCKQCAIKVTEMQICLLFYTQLVKTEVNQKIKCHVFLGSAAYESSSR